MINIYLEYDDTEKVYLHKVILERGFVNEKKKYFRK